ncbi:hypothetical protein BASA60_007477 [Batrachochytrium salamandrivorans]|nr:hypothetical protein BASA60_007477 [Batrachochytrium salamandrivorans]
MLQETNLDTNAFRFTAPKYSFIQHPANEPGKRGIALGFLDVLPARDIEGVPGTLILAKFLVSRSNRYSVPVQHRRLYRATTKKAIYKAKNAYRAWLASRDSILSPQETIQGKYNQYTLAEATASRLTKQDDHLRWRSHCTRIDNLLAGGCAKQAWNAAKRMACASGHLVDPPIQLEMKRVFFNSSLFPYVHHPTRTMIFGSMSHLLCHSAVVYTSSPGAFLGAWYHRA